MCMLHSLRRKSHGLRAVRSSTSCGSWKSRHTLCAVCQSMEDCRYLSWDPWFTPEHRDLLEPVMCFFPLKCVFRSTTRSPGPPDESADKLHAHASNGHRVLRVQQHCDAHRHYCAFCSPGLGSTPGPCLRRPRRRWFFYRAPCLGSRARRANRSARPVRASTAQIARST